MRSTSCTTATPKRGGGFYPRPSWNSPPLGCSWSCMQTYHFFCSETVALCTPSTIFYGEAVELRYVIPYRTLISAYCLRSKIVR